MKHESNTMEKITIKQQPCRKAYGTQPIIREEFERMLAQDIIDPSTSTWALPVVLVKKKDGTSRSCVDYSRLNEITIKDAYPLPRIEDNVDALQGACWFTTLDLASGYWQVEVPPKVREKTVFCTKQGYISSRSCPLASAMPQGPSNF